MNIEKLKRAGIEYEEGLARFMGNEALYKKYLKKFPVLPLYDEMKQAISRHELEAAFQAGHQLKAFVGNLSMNTFLGILQELTNRLRQNDDEGLSSLTAQLDDLHEQLSSVILEEVD